MLWVGSTYHSELNVLTTLIPCQLLEETEHLVVGVETLAGVAHTRATLEVPSLNSRDTSNSTDFALAIGGGLDIRVNDRI